MNDNPDIHPDVATQQPQTMSEQAVATQPIPRVVGVGASAGGLEAFSEFLRHTPSDTGMAFVFIQHLDPQHTSMLPELLAPHTSMSVNAICDQTPVAPNYVYLIPPNTVVTIAKGILYLDPPASHGLRLPINHFFRSLAEDQAERAVGIVLSGTGSDGTEGLAAIHACGGTTIAQIPTSAAYPQMPQSAIAWGVVDHVLDIAAMPSLLVASIQPQPNPSSETTLHKILSLIKQSTGHNFIHYKHATLQRRIAGRMQQLRITNIETYLEHMQQDCSEVNRLFRDLLIGVTEFFRDADAFEALAPTVFTNLLRGRDAHAILRIWVPGCATGEEAYSLAIMLHEYLAQLETAPTVQIFATDIDEAALVVARRGYYDASSTNHISPKRLARYFEVDGTGYRIAKFLRELCLFSLHNLISDPPFGRMDLIACRNLLIYFDADLQRQIIPTFHYALAPNGYLFLGSAESVTGSTDTSDMFRVIDARHRIYQRKDRLVQSKIVLPWAASTQPVPRISGVPPHLPSSSDKIATTIERVLIRDYAPTAIVIDPLGMVIYISGRAAPYLTVPAGIPTSNLFDLAHSDLRLPLRAALRTAFQTLTAVAREDITLILPDGQIRLNLTVRPFPDANLDSGLFLVILQSSGPPTPTFAQEDDEHLRNAEPAATTLAQELQRTRETLEATISELQESNLDLTAANEELRSVNEELHAANEELQTSKEEIQSINEELQTVNAELSLKIDEIDRVNTDLANLFASAQIPAIFLRTDGRISRFTAQATELFALIDADCGRPLADLKAKFVAGDLQTLISQVIETLEPIESIVYQPDGDRWWSMRIRPYHTLTNKVDGVVLTFADITILKQTEEILQHAHDDLESRVGVRTEELAKVNHALQVEIAAREQSEQARQRLIQQLVIAQEEERRQIAYELHDQLGQDFAVLILNLKALEEHVATNDEIAEWITQLRTTITQMDYYVRQLAMQLRPLVFDELGIELALRNYIEQWSERTRIPVDLQTNGLKENLLFESIQMTIYRIIQESLANVSKHAQASNVNVIIDQNGNRVRIIIEDDGIGFVVPTVRADLDVKHHLGLMGMWDRITLLGGDLLIESTIGSGTSIFANIPLFTI
ncbi:chemotaxis protein CheB [Candidatus Oscillochloris fontis]|uniref:chemotaxis protein CheB n=1 Tax=Candidatus Oscillochloris fontis TaxID=2496868 RepID=UPI00101BC69F|nr:chemotaxis protein CheB [Candidatus Oscillochloris fontis]